MDAEVWKQHKFDNVNRKFVDVASHSSLPRSTWNQDDAQIQCLCTFWQPPALLQVVRLTVQVTCKWTSSSTQVNQTVFVSCVAYCCKWWLNDWAWMRFFGPNLENMNGLRSWFWARSHSLAIDYISSVASVFVLSEACFCDGWFLTVASEDLVPTLKSVDQYAEWLVLSRVSWVCLWDVTITWTDQYFSPLFF